MARHVILDTDIGSDPDDALALLFGLSSPEIVIDLVVTSDEHEGHRAAFAKKLLDGMNRDIPVVKGRELGNYGLCHVCSLVEPSSEHEDCLARIRGVVLRNPETYYVCIGPQTNLASFLEYAPKLAERMQAVIMGGALDYSRESKADHNILSDIPSARKVLDSTVRKRYVLRDITRNRSLEVDAGHPIYGKIVGSDSAIGSLLAGNFKNYFERSHPSTFMHDPLTLCSAIRPEYLAFEQKHIVIDEGGKMRVSESGKPALVSASADYDAFMELFGERLPL